MQEVKCESCHSVLGPLKYKVAASIRKQIDGRGGGQVPLNFADETLFLCHASHLQVLWVMELAWLSMCKCRHKCQSVNKCCVPVSTMAEICKAESDVDTADEKNAYAVNFN